MAAGSFSILIAHSCFLLHLASAKLQCVDPPQQVIGVNEGASLTLPCVFQNISIGINFYWRSDVTLYANEVPDTEIEKYSLDYKNIKSDFTRSSNLTIAPVHRSDPLNYTCRARVGGGCIIQEKFTVIVKYPASINFIGPRQAPYWKSAEPDKIFVNETENITLNCNSGGEPLPTINWTRIYRDENFVGNASLADDTLDGVLRIINASRTQSGTYRCQSTNRFGNDTADVELVVQYAPEVHPSQTDIRAAPNDALAIGCDVTANPEPLDFYWMKDGVRILDDNGDDMETIPNAFVIFKLDPQNDYGNYTCIATSSIGTSTATIEISGRPLAPVILNEETQGSYGHFYTLVWSPTIVTEDNSSQAIKIPISRYIIQYQRQDLHNESKVSLTWPDEGLSASTSKHGSVVLYDLTENSSYVGLLCPENDYGIGDCASFTFTTSKIVYKPPPEPEFTGNACADSGTCVGEWVPSTAERYTSVTMVTISAGIISWCLKS